MTTAQFPQLSNAAQCFSQGRFTEAEHWCRLAEIMAPHVPDTYHLSSGIAAQTGRPQAALAHIDRAIGIAGGNALYPWHKGSLLFQLGQRQEAVAAFGRSIELNSHVAESWYDVGVALMPDDPDRAFLCLGRSALLQPGFGLAHQELGKMLQGEGALRRFTRALICQPDNPDSHNDLGKLHYEGRAYQEALDRFRRALLLDPANPVSLGNLGLATQAQKDFDKAANWHGRSVLAQPWNPDYLSNLGNCLQIMGHLEAAEPLLARAGELAPEDAKIQYAVAHRRKMRAEDPQIVAWEALAQHLPETDLDARSHLHFALAKAYDDIGEPARAFDHLLTANAARRALVEYDEAATEAKLERIRSVFTRDFIGRLKDAGDRSEQPVFIIGMPRSGSSLVEQILASHPDIFGAGELTDLTDFTDALGEERGVYYPELAAQLSAEDIAALGGRYASAQAARGQGAKRVTDKAPGNFWMAGFIHLMLPNAKIIHTKRDAVDTCLSCFSKLFQDVAFTYDLGELGRHWRLYDAMMAHWHEVLPTGTILDIHYEELVRDLPTQARRLIDHCGLEWSEDCLAFHETARPVNTASVLQVRRPLYQDAVGRWRPAAGKLKPLLDALDAK